jgi:hypothetical protein
VAQDVRWLMGTVWTVLDALVVFVITQSVLLLVLEPVQEQRRLIGEVASALTVYQKSFILRVGPPEWQRSRSGERTATLVAEGVR